MTFLEVPKFSKEDNIRSGIDQWMYIFKNLKNLKEVPRFLRIPKFKKLFAASNYLNMTEAEIQIYEAELGKMWDDHAILTSAVEEGREEGKVEEREAIVKTLLRMGKQTIAEIATICKMSEEEVLKLKRELV